MSPFSTWLPSLTRKRIVARPSISFTILTGFADASDPPSVTVICIGPLVTVAGAGRVASEGSSFEQPARARRTTMIVPKSRSGLVIEQGVAGFMVESLRGDDESAGIPVEIEVGDPEFDERIHEVVLGGDERLLGFQEVAGRCVAAQLEFIDGLDAPHGHGDGALLDAVG